MTTFGNRSFAENVIKAGQDSSEDFLHECPTYHFNHMMSAKPPVGSKGSAY